MLEPRLIEFNNLIPRSRFIMYLLLAYTLSTLASAECLYNLHYVTKKIINISYKCIAAGLHGYYRPVNFKTNNEEIILKCKFHYISAKF